MPPFCWSISSLFPLLWPFSLPVERSFSSSHWSSKVLRLFWLFFFSFVKLVGANPNPWPFEEKCEDRAFSNCFSWLANKFVLSWTLLACLADVIIGFATFPLLPMPINLRNFSLVWSFPRLAVSHWLKEDLLFVPFDVISGLEVGFVSLASSGSSSSVALRFFFFFFSEVSSSCTWSLVIDSGLTESGVGDIAAGGSLIAFSNKSQVFSMLAGANFRDKTFLQKFINFGRFLGMFSYPCIASKTSLTSLSKESPSVSTRTSSRSSHAACFFAPLFAFALGCHPLALYFSASLMHEVWSLYVSPGKSFWQSIQVNTSQLRHWCI